MNNATTERKMATQTKTIAAIKLQFDTMFNCDYRTHNITIKSGDKAAWNKMLDIDKKVRSSLKSACMEAIKTGKDVACGNTFVSIVWAK
jgi:hypothetical protein